MSKTTSSSLCKVLMRGLGITLVMFFFILYVIIFYSYVYDLCQMYYVYYQQNLFAGLLLLFFGYYIAFCIIFNHIMAIFVNPGVPASEIRGFSGQSMKGEIDSSDDEEEVREPNHFKSSTQESKYRVCKICKDIKPPRAHHCSICNLCVLKMDHHCPWIDNCVGFHNHRYFLSLILYLFFATAYMAVLYIYVENNFDVFSQTRIPLSAVYNLSKILCIVLSIVLLLFNWWNWYLASKGLTAIEYWGNRADSRYQQIKTYALPTARENLYYIFGTHSYLMMLLPSIRPLPHDGTQWENEGDSYKKQKNSSRSHQSRFQDEESGMIVARNDLEGGL